MVTGSQRVSAFVIWNIMPNGPPKNATNLYSHRQCLKMLISPNIVITVHTLHLHRCYQIVVWGKSLVIDISPVPPPYIGQYDLLHLCQSYRWHVTPRWHLIFLSLIISKVVYLVYVYWPVVVLLVSVQSFPLTNFNFQTSFPN